MERPVSFTSDGLRLNGLLGLPDAGGKAPHPAIVVMHGFGGHNDGPQQRWSAPFYRSLGYATLRFDFRGCGQSEGQRGRIVPAEEVSDAIAAVRFLATVPGIDASRIALSGTSYGGTVAAAAAAREPAITAVISQGGWGNGERMFRHLHPTPEAWSRFTALLDEGRRRQADGEPGMTAHRWDLIPVPERLRDNIDPRSIFEFQIATGMETLAFNAADEIAGMHPRPMLLIHSADDDVIHPQGSWDLFAAAPQPCDLVIVSCVDHFMFGEGDMRVANVLRDWLARYLPAA